MDKQQVKHLLYKYQQGTCTELEKAQLESWYIRQEIPPVFDMTETELETELDKIWNALDDEYQATRKVKPLWPKLLVAASVLVFITIGVWIYTASTTQPGNNSQLVKNPAQVLPGGDKAILIDATGKQESLNDGVFVVANHAVPSNGVNTAQAYNTILTPNGGQYQVVLSDGTRVWLNAASSLKYPVEFTGTERRVELIGEGYFEVAHNAAKPFRVVSNTQVVEVLGTHFNINTYSNEPAVKTTLLEGAVSVTALADNKQHKLILKPGEQAVSTPAHISKQAVDVEEAVAWHKGFFQFDNASLETVMRQLSRWYDLDVKYEGAVPQRVFNGKVYRNMSLAKVLNVLSFSEVNYKVEGKTLIITP